MSTNITGRTGVIIDLKNVEALTTKLSEVLDELGIDTNIKWSFGVGIKECNVLYHDKITKPATETETLNLFDSSGPALQDAFGNDLTMTAIKFLYIKNTSADLKVTAFGGTGGLLIMDGISEAMKLEPEGFMLWACPTLAGIVVDTTNKNLKLTVGTGTGNAIIDVVAMGLD